MACALVASALAVAAQQPDAAPGGPEQFLGHAGSVSAAEYAAGGRLLVTGSFDNTARIFDAASGASLRTLEGHQGQVLSLALSSDGARLLTGSRDNTLRLWDMLVPHPLAVWQGHQDTITALALSPDGTHALTSSADRTLRLWQRADGSTLLTLEGHQAAVAAAAYRRDGGEVASADETGQILVWNPRDGQRLASLFSPGGRVHSLAYGPNNQLLASGSSDGAVRIWQLPQQPPTELAAHAGELRAMAFAAGGQAVFTATAAGEVRAVDGNGQVLRTYAGQPGEPTTLVLSSDGGLLAAASRTGHVKLWNAADASDRHMLAAHLGAVTDVAIHPNNQQFATTGGDGLVRIWQLPQAPRELAGHEAAEAVACLSADGGWAVTGTADGKLRLWNATNAQLVRELPPQGQPITALAFRRDSGLLASGDVAGGIRLIQPQDGTLLAALSAPGGPITWLAWHANQQQFVSTSGDGTVRLWRLPPTPSRTLQGHADQVTCVAAAPAGQVAYTGSLDQTVRAFDAASGQLQRQFNNVLGPVLALAVSADGGLLAAATRGGIVQFWNAGDGADRLSLATGASVRGLAFHPQGQGLATAAEDGTVRLWQLPTPPRVLAGHGQPVTVVAISPDGELACTSGADRMLRLWRVADGGQLRTWEGHPQSVTAAVFHPTQPQLATADTAGQIRVWSLEGTPVAEFFSPGGAVQTLAYDDVGTRLLTASADGSLRIWELPQAGAKSWQVHSDQATAVVVLGGGTHIVSCGLDQTVRLLDTAVGQQVRVFEGHSGPATALTANAEENLIASGSATGIIKLWNLADGADRFALAGHAGPVRSLAFSPRGRLLASAGEDGTLRVWSLPVAPQTLAGHSQAVLAMAASPDEKLLATAAADNAVKVWKLTTGEAAGTLAGHAGPVTGIAWSQDATRIVTCSADRTVRVWDAATFQQVLQCTGHEAEFKSVALAAGQVFAGGTDGVVAVFNLSDGTLLRKLEGLGAAVVQAASADGRLLVALADGLLRTFDMQGNPGWTASHGAGLVGLAASTELAATAGTDRVVRLWRLADGAAAAILPAQPADLAGISFCGPARLALACADGVARVVALDGRLEESYATPNVAQLCVARAGGDRYLAVGGADGQTRIYTRSLERLLPAHQGAATSLAWLDQDRLASGGADGIVRLWSRNAAQSVAELAASGPVTSLAAANDGKLLAAASEAKLLLVWNVDQPQTPVLSLSLEAVPRSVVLDRAGSTVLVGMDDQSIAVFDVATGQPLERLRGHAGAVLSLALSADGRVVASASADRTVRLATRAAQRVFAAHQGPARAAWLAEGEGFVSAGADGRLQLWDAQAAATRVLEGLAGPIAALATSPSGTLLAAAAEQAVQVWQMPAARPLSRLQLSQACVGLSFSSDGRRLAAACADGRVRLFDPQAGRLLEELPASPSPLASVALAPDGKIVLAGGADQARLLPLSLLAVLGTHKGGAAALAFAPDGARLASTGADGRVRVWSLSQHEAVANLNAGEAASCVAWSADGQRLLCGAGQKLHIWNLADQQAAAFGKQEAVLELPGTVLSLAVLREPDRVAVGCEDGAVHVWSLSGRRELERLQRHSGAVLGLATAGNVVFSAAADQTAAVGPLACEVSLAAHTSSCRAAAWLDEARFATAGDDGRVRIFDITGKPLQQLEAAGTPLAAMALRPDGAELAAAGGKTIFRWNLAEPAPPTRRNLQADITTLAYSADGAKLAAGCQDGQVRLYATKDARLLERFESAAAIRSLAFAPDHRTLLASTSDGRARLVTASLATLLAGHKGGGSALAWFADGSRLISTGADGRLLVWNPADGSMLAALKTAGERLGRVAVSRDGTRVAVAAGKAVLVWNTADVTREGGPPEPLRLEHAAAVIALKFSPDSQRLATAADDGLVRIWDPILGLPLEQLVASTSPAVAVQWADDSRTLATAAADGTLWLRRTTALRVLPCTPGPVHAIAWLPDGSLAVAGEDGRVRSFDGNGNQNRLLEGAAGVLFSLAARPDGQQIAAGSANRKIYLWSPGGELIRQIETPAAVRALAFSQDNQRLLAGGDDGHLRVFHTQDGKLLDDFTDAAPISAVAIAPDNKTLYSASGSSVKEWLHASAQAVRTLGGHGAQVYAVAFAPQGTLAASASADQTIRIWDTANGSQLRQLTGHQGSVYTIAYSPDGGLLASGGADTTVRIWDASTGGELKRLPGPTAPVYSVSFSPDGRLLAAGGLDKTVRVWDVATSELRWSGTGHTDHIYRVVFNPQGTRLLSCGYAGHLHVWDAATGTLLFAHRLPAVAYYAAYHPSGDRVVAACADAAAHVVALPAEAR